MLTLTQRVLLVICLISFPIQAFCGTTFISYSETFQNGETFTDEVSLSALNSASIGGDPLDGGGNPDYPGIIAYGASSDFAIGDFTELKTNANAFVNAFSNDEADYNWTSIEMTATAVSTLAAFGVVDTTNSPGNSPTSGSVQLTWEVDGTSNALLQGVMNATVELSSTTTLSQTTVGGTNVFSTTAPNMSGDTSVTSNLGDYTIDIPWGVDPSTPEIPVFFELKSQLTLSATNDNGSGQFVANADAMFFNTAKLNLSKTVVKGPGGTAIPGATFSLSPVPEPSSASLIALLVSFFGFRQWKQTRLRSEGE